MACWMTAPSHYLNQFWLIIIGVFWHTPACSFTGNAKYIYHWYEFENDCFKITTACLRGQLVKVYMCQWAATKLVQVLIYCMTAQRHYPWISVVKKQQKYTPKWQVLRPSPNRSICTLWWITSGGRLNIQKSSCQYRDPMLKIRRSCDCLIVNMGITMHWKDDLYIETGPRLCCTWLLTHNISDVTGEKFLYIALLQINVNQHHHYSCTFKICFSAFRQRMHVLFICWRLYGLRAKLRHSENHVLFCSYLIYVEHL